jgi:hypothetical protein
MWSREDAKQVPGLGGSAEGRARRWRSGGGRGSSGSGGRAGRLVSVRNVVPTLTSNKR